MLHSEEVVKGKMRCKQGYQNQWVRRLRMQYRPLMFLGGEEVKEEVVTRHADETNVDGSRPLCMRPIDIGPCLVCRALCSVDAAALAARPCLTRMDQMRARGEMRERLCYWKRGEDTTTLPAERGHRALFVRAASSRSWNRSPTGKSRRCRHTGGNGEGDASFVNRSASCS